MPKKVRASRTNPGVGLAPLITVPGAKSRWGEYRERMARDRTIDNARREAIQALVKVTGRSLVLYATAFHYQPKAGSPLGSMMSIQLADVSGFREITNDLPGGGLDLVLHTPGGSADAAAGIVRLLRSKFSDIRVIVPLAAKSAGTMLAMSGARISMLPGAELGPIDPQVLIGSRFVPAKAIVNQFERAASDIMKEPKRIPAWMPLLSPLGPSMLEECEKALSLAKGLVKDWLRTGMFLGHADAEEKAARVADFLADYEQHRSHARPIHVEDLKPLGVRIGYLADESAELERRVTDLWLTVDLTCTGSEAYKIFENSRLQAMYHQAKVSVRVEGEGEG